MNEFRKYINLFETLIAEDEDEDSLLSNQGAVSVSVPNKWIHPGSIEHKILFFFDNGINVYDVASKLNIDTGVVMSAMNTISSKYSKGREAKYALFIKPYSAPELTEKGQRVLYLLDLEYTVNIKNLDIKESIKHKTPVSDLAIRLNIKKSDTNPRYRALQLAMDYIGHKVYSSSSFGNDLGAARLLASEGIFKIIDVIGKTGVTRRSEYQLTELGEQLFNYVEDNT
jgi:hypothetical protein